MVPGPEHLKPHSHVQGAIQLMVIPSSNRLLSYRHLHLRCWRPIAQLESSWFLNMKSMRSLIISEAVLGLDRYKNTQRKSWRYGEEKQEFDLYRHFLLYPPFFGWTRLKGFFKNHTYQLYWCKFRNIYFKQWQWESRSILNPPNFYQCMRSFSH